MEAFATIIIFAVLIQAVVEAVKGALCKWDYISLALGAVLCPLAGLDAFTIVKLPLAVPYVGAVLTGIIAGRGAAFVYDIIERVKNNPIQLIEVDPEE